MRSNRSPSALPSARPLLLRVPGATGLSPACEERGGDLHIQEVARCVSSSAAFQGHRIRAGAFEVLPVRLQAFLSAVLAARSAVDYVMAAATPARLGCVPVSSSGNAPGAGSACGPAIRWSLSARIGSCQQILALESGRVGFVPLHRKQFEAWCVRSGARAPV